MICEHQRAGVAGSFTYATTSTFTIWEIAMSDEPNGSCPFLKSVLRKFEGQKSLAEEAIRQLSNDNLQKQLHPVVNSVAVIMKHMAGNMLSRWTDFLTTDGEKEWRHRDQEFVDEFQSREEMMKYWQSGWQCLFHAIESLDSHDLEKIVTIRGENHTVYDAIIRQLDHYGYHIGQIVLTARLLVGDGPWQTLSIARGESNQYNAKNWGSE